MQIYLLSHLLSFEFTSTKTAEYTDILTDTTVAIVAITVAICLFFCLILPSMQIPSEEFVL